MLTRGTCAVIAMLMMIPTLICALIGLENAGKLPERDKVAKVWLILTFIFVGLAMGMICIMACV